MSDGFPLQPMKFCRDVARDPGICKAIVLERYHPSTLIKYRISSSTSPGSATVCAISSRKVSRNRRLRRCAATRSAVGVIWGALIEFAGWVCPLTPLENRLRESGGATGYAGGFVEHYIVPLVYPTEISRQMQIVLGVAVVLVNGAAYGMVWRRRHRGRSARS
jgi:hypothetical protein